MTKTNNFYQDKDILDSSKRGYYPDKTNFIIDYLKQNKGKRILDLACNDGELTKKYTKYGNVVGVELNKQALKICKKKGLECYYADVTDLPSSFKDSFDIVIAGDIIEHVFDTDKFLQQVKKVLKKDGSLILTTPNVASLGRRVILSLGGNPYLEYSTQLPYPFFNVGHIRYYTKKDLANQLAHNGFKDIVVSGNRINITESIYLPISIAKHFPSISRDFFVTAKK